MPHIHEVGVAIRPHHLTSPSRALYVSARPRFRTQSHCPERVARSTNLIFPHAAGLTATPSATPTAASWGPHAPFPRCTSCHVERVESLKRPRPAAPLERRRSTLALEDAEADRPENVHGTSKSTSKALKISENLRKSMKIC